MDTPLEALESQVLRLPAADRARLLDRVVASLDADTARDKAWDAVAANREELARNDATLMVSTDSVLEQLRAELK